MANTNEQVVILNVDDISVDRRWNARQGDWVSDGDSMSEQTGYAGFAGLYASIRETGINDEPVVCRPAATPKGKVRLVAGFRRHAAIAKLCEDAKGLGPTPAEMGKIRVVLRDMTDVEARCLNIRENTARDDLRGPDLAWSIRELIRAHSLTDTTIAHQIGKSQPYVSRLNRITKKLCDKVLDMWRQSSSKVTLDDIEKQVVPVKEGSDAAPSPAEQEEAFKRVLVAKDAPKKGRGPDGWIVTKEGKAKEIGNMLGMLAHTNCVEILVDCKEIVNKCIVFPKSFEDKDAKMQKAIRARMVKAMNDGMLAAKHTPEKGDEGDEGDE